MSIPVTDERTLPVFIHSELDDFGLSPAQFRIYCRIARRAGKGECIESIDSIAKGCGISTGTAKRALKFLDDHRLVIRKPRCGLTTSYVLTDPTQWIPITDNPETKGWITTDPGGGSSQTQGVDHLRPGSLQTQVAHDRGGGSPQTQGVDHERPTKVLHEGSPSEGTPHTRAACAQNEDSRNSSFSNNGAIALVEFSESRSAIAATQTCSFDQPQNPDAEFEARVETDLPPPSGIPQKSAMPRDRTGEHFRRDLPKWRSGWGPNDWDEGFIQFLLRHWLARMPYYQQQGGVTRGHAISWLRKRDLSEAMHPAILDAYQAMEDAQAQRQQAEQQILAAVSSETTDPPEPLPALTLADHAARLSAKLLIPNARRAVEAEIDRNFAGELMLVEQGDTAQIILIGQEVAA